MNETRRMRFGRITHPLFREHDPGRGHPERPERIGAAEQAFRKAAPLFDVVARAARPAELAELQRVHTQGLIDHVLSFRGRRGSIDADTHISPASVDAALLAAGSAIDLARMIMSGEADTGFLFARPPGHHAERAQTMGFCLFNNIAAASAALLEEGLAKRIAIYDWDVHHGNGVQDIFYADPRVLFISSHQSPLYPGTGAEEETGEGPGAGYNLNLPLSPGSHDGDFAAAVSRAVVPAIRKFAPDIILIPAGFDAHAADPLAQLEFTERGFAHAAGLLKSLAGECCGGRIGFILEGGYDLKALRDSIGAVLKTMAGGAIPDAAGFPAASHSTNLMIARQRSRFNLDGA
ncbi:MAG: hypothetical protein GMKNLPBB_01432 [Myxococcota bacterium]|nr:hypothetical protein [Myxococcota bacterium]